MNAQEWKHCLKAISDAHDRQAADLADAQARLAHARAEAKHYQDVAQRNLNKRLALEREIHALRAKGGVSTPPSVEREVDRELREAWPGWDNRPDVDITIYSPETQRLIRAGRAWLAAPLSAAPSRDTLSVDSLRRTHESMRADSAMYGAVAGTARRYVSPPSPAEKRRYVVVAPNGSVLPSLYDEQERTHELEKGYRWFRAVEDHGQPKPAEERVTLYIPEFRRGMSGLVYSSSERSRVVDVQRWLAIDARVVREGGAA